MKVLGFVGSPRKGANTDMLVSEVLIGAAEKGAQTAIYNINELNIRGCQSCFYCSDNIGCAQKDGMQNFYEEIRNAEAVVLGCPIYMWQVSAQTKVFVDRLLPFLNPEYAIKGENGKSLIMVYTHWEEDPETFRAYFDMTNQMMESIGFKIRNSLIGAGMEGTDCVKERKGLMEKARMIGRSLL